MVETAWHDGKYANTYGMKSNIEILRDELNRRTGEIRRIADAVDMSYDTVLRIKNGECDPGFAKV